MSNCYNRTYILKANQPQIKQENRSSSNYMGYNQKPTQNVQEYTMKYSEKTQNKFLGAYFGDRQTSVQHSTNNYISHNYRQNITPNYQDQKNELYFKSYLQDNNKTANKGQILQQTLNQKNSYENNLNLSNNYQKNFEQTKYLIGTQPSYLTKIIEKNNIEKYQKNQDIYKQQNSAKSQYQYQNYQINQHLQNENYTYSQTNQNNVTTQNIHYLRTTTSSSITNRNLNSPQPKQQKSIINQNLQQLQNASKFDPHSQINQQKALHQFVKQTSNSQLNSNKIVQQEDYNQYNNQQYGYSFQNYQKKERNSNLQSKDHINPNNEASQINNQSQKINQTLIQKSQSIQNDNQSIIKKQDQASFNSNSSQNNIRNKDQTRDSASQSSSRSLITSQNKFELASYEKSELNNLKKQQIQSQNVNLRAQEDNLIKGNQQSNISSSNTNKMQNNSQLKMQENNQNNANCESQNKTQKSLADTQTNLLQNQENSVSEHLELSKKNPLQQNQQKSNQDNQKQQQLDNESQTQNLTSQQNNVSSRNGRMVEQSFQANKRSSTNDQAQKKTQYNQKQNDSIQQIYYTYEQQLNNKEAKSSNTRNNQYVIESKDLNNSQYFDKIKIGLPNIGLTCYINSAIQTLRQVYYFDQKIFENPGFSKDFQQLFQFMEERNTSKITFLIQKIVEKSKQNQKHTFGGDAYMCVYNLLSEIKKSLPDNQKQQFDDLFLRNYKDKLKCGRCKRQKIPNDNQFITCLDYQEFGYECSKLDDAFQDNSDLDLFKEINSDDLICPQCRDQLQSIRKYKYAPKFMLIRLLSFIPKERCPEILKKKFEYLVNLKTTQKYEIIGFCNYYGYHYTYTAKYNNKWIEFNDSNSYEVSPDCSKAIYFLLKRI